MLTLRRTRHLQAQLPLPGGERLDVDLDVAAHLPALIRAQNDLILTARAPEGGSAESGDSFYEAYRALLRIALGPDGLNRALAACDGALPVLCAHLDGWVATALVPRIRAASADRVRRCRAQARRMLRRAR